MTTNRNEKPTQREIQGAKIRTRIVDKLVNPELITADDVKAATQSRKRSEAMKIALKKKRVDNLLKKASKYSKNSIKANPSLKDAFGRPL